MQTKRILSLLLAAALLMGLCALPAHAEDTHVSVSALKYTTSGGKATITGCAEGARGRLEIPETLDGCKVTSLAKGAFSGCDQITSVTIPNTVTYIGEWTFSRCKGITGVIVPDSVTKMGMCAFEECTSLQSIRIGRGLKVIPYGMCSECPSLRSVELSNGLEELGMKAFNECTSLTSITLPNTLKKMSSAFSYSGLESVVIPDSVEIVDHTFSWCNNLKSVKLGRNVKEIGDFAFIDTAIESMVVPDSVQKIGDVAFADCKNLKEVTLGSGLRELQKSVFRGCSSLETLVIRDGIQRIGTKQGYSAQVPFSGCKSLRTLYLPGSLVEVGRYTFRDCTQLSDIYFGGTSYAWGGMAIAKDNDPILNARMHYVPFKDARAGEYYYTPMIWAIDKGITMGTTDTTFSPGRTCLQSEILTFLYRAAGSPSVSGGSPYTNRNIDPSKYYYNALLWAYQQGVVTDKNLDPNASCKRSDVALYLWRLADKPSGSGTAFTDVPSSAPYAQAVSWAVQSGVTQGTSATTFSPNNICTRAEIVTFLHRYFVG